MKPGRGHLNDLKEVFLSDHVLEALAKPPDRVLLIEEGAVLPWKGSGAYDTFMVPLVGVEEVPGALDIMGDFAGLLLNAQKFRVSNPPLRAGLEGAVIAPGLTRLELDGFVSFLDQQGGLVWIEFDVAETGKGLLCQSKGRKVRFYEVTGNHAAEDRIGVIGFMPYAIDLGLYDLTEDNGFSVEPYDPLGVYMRLGVIEAELQALRSVDEIRGVMLRECSMAILIGACLAYPSTTIVRRSDDLRRVEARLGRDPHADVIRVREGLQVW